MEQRNLKSKSNMIAEIKNSLKSCTPQNNDIVTAKLLTNNNLLNENTNKAVGGNINVVLRCRPFNEKEKKMSNDICLDFLDSQTVNIKSTAENNNYKFTFDRSFNPDSLQKEIYDFAAKPIIDSVMEGFNGTIFAYGQTSSGKTFTMQGVLDNPELEGIIPRMIRYVFDFIDKIKLQDKDNSIQFIVKISMIEIYNEKIRDLIDQTRSNLQVREDKTKGIYIEDLSDHCADNSPDVLKLMKKGMDNRSVNCTNMNAESSRSHSVVIVTITQNNLKDLSVKSGKLYLVDLAGSEKISKTGATGTVLNEAKAINKSLTTLGIVIMALTDGKQGHIPYRESKLTRVLQESLGGNARTCLIITCSPSNYNESETLSTLRFGIRAKKVKNKAKINKESSVQELKVEVGKLEGQLGKFKNRVDILESFLVKNGLPMPSEDGNNLDTSMIRVIVQSIQNKNPSSKSSSNILEKQNDDEIVITEEKMSEINCKYIEVLDIVNELEYEKIILEEKLNSASKRIHEFNLEKERKEELIKELENMRQVHDTKTEEMEKEVNKMKNYMEKNTHNISIITETNKDMIIIPTSLANMNNILAEVNGEKKLNLSLQNEYPPFNVEIITQECDELSYKYKDKSKPNSNNNSTHSNHYQNTNYLTLTTNMNPNLESLNNSNIHNTTPLCIGNLTSYNSGTSYNKKALDDLLSKLKDFSDKCPEISSLIESYKEKIYQNPNQQSLQELEITLGRKLSMLSKDDDLNATADFKIEEIVEDEIIKKNNLLKIFDSHIRDKEFLNQAINDKKFCNWNLKNWKEKFKNVVPVGNKSD